MKLLQWLFCLVLFAAVALADSAPLSRGDLTNNYTTNSTYPEPPPGVLVWGYAEIMSGPEPKDRFANLMVPVLAESEDSSGVNLPIIRMSTNRQYVAEITRQRLWDKVHEALHATCPLERGVIGCYPGMPGSGRPNDDNSLPQGVVYNDEVWITTVPYKDDHGDYATNAWITITATGIFRDQKYPGIGAALYEMAAGVYKEVTEADFNCYYENHFNTHARPYRFCVVPHRILIAFPANKDQIIDAWLQVTVEFNGKTTVGHLDCDKTTTNSNVTSFWKGAVLPDVTKAMGNSAEDWSDPCLECFSEDGAFDLESWRASQHCNAHYKASE